MCLAVCGVADTPQLGGAVLYPSMTDSSPRALTADEYQQCPSYNEDFASSRLGEEEACEQHHCL